ncbi:MAG: acetaldehyde dehydrogenase (acetylating) [Alphaproteobacteria bacterium]|nr:acetaldehyde dehydrogenase (acetylating) [Alphaproteobacteria bacterium]
MVKKKVAILGTGKIGTDLLVKILRSPFLECTYFIGRHLDSDGILKAKSLGVNVSDESIHAIIKNKDNIDLIFDATSAVDARYHWSIIEPLGKFVIDLTPAKVGKVCIPALNLDVVNNAQNINMITCGGQASIPMAYCIASTQKNVPYIEIVTNAANKGAGPATIKNLDEYIFTTEGAIKSFCKIPASKVIVNLNPKVPEVNMQNTIYALVARPDFVALNEAVFRMEKLMQSYVPGYSILVPPVWENGKIMIEVQVLGLGDYIPSYAGNLDIINCAAIAVAEKFAQQK